MHSCAQLAQLAHPAASSSTWETLVSKFNWRQMTLRASFARPLSKECPDLLSKVGRCRLISGCPQVDRSLTPG
jgi:hypothetical protein